MMLGGFEQPLGMQQMPIYGAAQQQTPSASQQYYQNLERQSKPGGYAGGLDTSMEVLVKVDSDLTYEQAKSLLHSHILDLDI